MKRFSALILFFILFIISAKFAPKVNAQYFSMELENPGSQINVNDIFNVKIMINTEGVEAINGDALLIFDPTKLNILNATGDNFFTFSFSTLISGMSNKYLASSWEESIAHAKSSSAETPFYTLSVKAIGAGQTDMKFECAQGSEADTNINRSSDSADVVNCPLNPLSLNIGSAGGPTSEPQPTSPGGEPSPTDSIQTEPTPTFTTTPTNTPTLTPTKTPTRTPTPTDQLATISADQLPRAGIISNTIGLIGLGSVLTFIGLIIML